MADPEEKSNGLGGNSLQRLASFKPPRDLSLGGVKPNKKVFTPNLNVTRNKNKGPNNAASREHKKDDKNRRDRKNDRNKNFKNSSNIIKSSGVFSEGLGSAERHTSRASYANRDVGAAPTLQKPTIRVKDVIKIDKELEEQKIKSVMGECGGSDEEVSEDFKRLQEIDAPVKLPMDDGSWSQNQKPMAKVKQEIIVKKEPKDDSDSMELADPLDEKPPADMKEVFEDTDVVKLLRNDKPTLILLQLPDSLPGRGGSVEDEAPRRKHSANEQPSTSTPDTDADKPVDNRCRLTELEEGRIGKLLIHRSGRVSMALGDTIFEVCSATKAAFYQEAVSVAVDESSRSANIVALGALQHKLNIVPDWEAMFSDIHV